MEKFYNNINLVRSIVNKMNFGYLDKDDLLQAGLMGLYQATKRFNESLGVNFSTFATHYIIGEIKQEIRNNQAIKLSRKIKQIISVLKDSESLSIEELSEKIGATKANILLALTYKERVISLNKEEENGELIDTIAATIDERDVDLDEAKSVLKDNMYKIIYEKYYLGSTQNEISKKLKISQSNISRMEKKALVLLKKYYLNQRK